MREEKVLDQPVTGMMEKHQWSPSSPSGAGRINLARQYEQILLRRKPVVHHDTRL
jgi:hypothetical protein